MEQERDEERRRLAPEVTCFLVFGVLVFDRTSKVDRKKRQMATSIVLNARPS